MSTSYRIGEETFRECRKKVSEFNGDPERLVVDVATFDVLWKYHAETMKPYCPPLKTGKNTWFFMGIDVQRTQHKKKRIVVKPR